MFFKSRLARIERRIVPRERPKELKVHFVFGGELVPQDKDGKPLKDYGEYEDDVLVVRVVKTEGADMNKVTTAGVTPTNGGGGGVTAELEREIMLLEKRKAELQRRAKA